MTKYGYTGGVKDYKEICKRHSIGIMQKEVLQLLDDYIEMDNRRFKNLPGGPDERLARIRELLTKMWGE